MRHEMAPDSVAGLVRALNRKAGAADARRILGLAAEALPAGKLALVSSFGAESVVLLHMVSRLDPALPVLFLDTGMLFRETLEYRERVTRHLGLSDVRHLHPQPAQIRRSDPAQDLHRHSPDACCALRRTAPLQHALQGFCGWITGRKRYQSGSRADLAHFEVDAAGRIKVNPLSHWQPGDIRRYMDSHDLPRHPLVGRGYPSIGCAPCTSPVRRGEDPRAGRWRNREKTECGIHLPPAPGRDISESGGPTP